MQKQRIPHLGQINKNKTQRGSKSHKVGLRRRSQKHLGDSVQAEGRLAGTGSEIPPPRWTVAPGSSFSLLQLPPHFLPRGVVVSSKHVGRPHPRRHRVPSKLLQSVMMAATLAQSGRPSVPSGWGRCA